MNSNQENNRYQRQLILKELGEVGQEKLVKAKVLVIGAGGLGCPALQYLTAAGIGTIGIVDFDVIELSNLQRQPLYAVEDIGKLKVDVSETKLRAINPEININVFRTQLTNQNALVIINQFDLVLDCTDNFLTRYIINDTCILLNKAFIYGAVLRFEGQCAVFNLKDIKTGTQTNYRDLFPTADDAALSCNEAGILGVLPGIIGTIQASATFNLTQ